MADERLWAMTSTSLAPDPQFSYTTWQTQFTIWSPSVHSAQCLWPHLCLCARVCVCVCVCVYAFMHAGTGTKSGAVQQLRGPASWSLANSDPHSQPGLKRVRQTQSDPQTGQITKLKGVTTEERGCHISVFACLPREQQVLKAWESI